MKDTEVEIAVLQTQVKGLQEQFTQAELRHEKHMETVYAKLDGLKSDIAKRIPCPDPGSCLRLEQQLRATESKVEILNNARQRSIGEVAAIGVIAGAVGPMIMALFVWWLNK